MNLIEQLGGYEKANNKLLKMDKILKEVYYSPSDAQKANELRHALLEYRRQHNIFEVGDKVVFVSDKLSCGVKEIVEIINNNWVVFKQDGFHVKLVRHATDEEIEARRRLHD